MKVQILVAHKTNPTDFANEFNIEFLGETCLILLEDIIELLNENEFRDCIFKVGEEI